MNSTEFVKVIRKCLDYMERDGFDVEETTDYDRAVKGLEGIGKSYLTPAMSPYKNDFTPQNCFWMLVKKHSPEKQEPILVGGIGARKDRIGDESLTGFWERSLSRQYDSSDSSVVNPLSASVERDVRGDVTYFGDLFFAKEYRNWGVHLRCFTLYAQMIAALKFNSDWSYSFIGQDRAEKVGNWQYGFSRINPGAQEWLKRIDTRGSLEYCVYNSRLDLIDMARHYARFPEQLGVVQNAPEPAGVSNGK